MGFVIDEQGNYLPVFGESAGGGGDIPADVLRNTATGTDGLTILGTATDRQNAINIGVGSAVTGNHSTVIGTNASAGGATAIAVGRNSKASANYAIQIGQGTNSTANSLSVGFNNTQNYTLLDGETGKVPSERYENFIPSGTAFTIKSDDTGDFSTIQSAFNYLTGKWSNGYIRFDIGSGTFSTANRIDLNGNVSGIKLIQIYGAGVDSTIIQRTGTASEQTQYGIIRFINTNVEIQDITFKQLNGDKTTDTRGIQFNNFSKAQLLRCNFVGCSGGFWANPTTSVTIASTFTFTNCRQGIVASGGSIGSNYGASLTFDNCNIGISASGGGDVRLNTNTCTFTNTTTKTNITKNTLDQYGFILTGGSTGF